MSGYNYFALSGEDQRLVELLRRCSVRASKHLDQVSPRALEVQLFALEAEVESDEDWLSWSEVTFRDVDPDTVALLRSRCVGNRALIDKLRSTLSLIFLSEYYSSLDFSDYSAVLSRLVSIPAIADCADPGADVEDSPSSQRKAARSAAYSYLRRMRGVVDVQSPSRSFDTPGLEALFNARVESLRRSTAYLRKSEYEERLSVEIVEARRNGWYVIFQTLTCRDDAYTEVFREGSDEWRKYRQRFEYMINECCGDTSVPAGTNCRYFAVEERGSKTKRLHLHVLWMCRDLPHSWKDDPNLDRLIPDYQEIRSNTLWPHGIVNDVAVRYRDDAFTRLGWRWPVDRETKSPVERNLGGLRGYLLKYVTKSLFEKEDSQWLRKTRVRMTRGFGLGPSLAIAAKMTAAQRRIVAKTLPTTAREKMIGRACQMRRLQSCARRKPRAVWRIVTGPRSGSIAGSLLSSPLDLALTGRKAYQDLRSIGVIARLNGSSAGISERAVRELFLSRGDALAERPVFDQFPEFYRNYLVDYSREYDLPFREQAVGQRC